ncbi:MAG: glycosyltransferase family 4 protein [Gammaproteobacteria bacterium]|nr:glycosyltransferase family 4 protein [Gammaproteobacteria bacterium]
MKILTFTNLFPSVARPRHGVFVENRLQQFCRRHPDAQVRVVAPVPWFPLKHRVFGAYSEFAKVEREADRGWALASYPRYPVIPKIGMTIAPWLMARACYAPLRKIIADGFDFDVLDAHYLYPDGVAAMMLAKRLGKPLVCTARGTDLTVIPGFTGPRKMIGRAVESCDTVITVCQALKDEIERLGFRPNKIEVLRNGVDLQLFRPPDDREAVRRDLGMKGFSILSVGKLDENKGHHLVIEALRKLTDVTLLIAGSGPRGQQLEKQAADAGIADRVRFLGTVGHSKLPAYYGGADISLLASATEGWANVLLESMACGTPVVATRIWGTPEVVRSPAAGRLIERTPEDIANGIRALQQDMPDRAATRAYAEEFSWDETSDRLYEIFRRIIGEKFAESPATEAPTH